MLKHSKVEANKKLIRRHQRFTSITIVSRAEMIVRNGRIATLVAFSAAGP